MSRTTGEALREAILRGISEWWDRQDFGSCEVEDTSVVAAAIVKELGITREDVNKAIVGHGPHIRRLALGWSRVLDCAEVEP